MSLPDTKEKIKIFVAFSYDDEDKALTTKIIDFIKKPEFGFAPYIVGEHKDVNFLDEQIQKNIYESEGIFAIFTKRYDAVDSKSIKSVLPPAMIISESSFAMGRQYGFSKKTYAAMYEKGIHPEPRDIGLIAMRRLNMVNFNREDILHKKGYLREILEGYLKDLRKNIIEETEKRTIHPYKQNTLDKTLYLYNNGTAIAEVHSKVTILDDNEFKGIDHLIYLNVDNKTLPKFNDMVKQEPSEKPTKCFFATLIKKINDKKIDVPFDVIEREGREAKKIPLTFNIPLDKLTNIKTFKSEDIIEYEFAWGYPYLYKTTKDYTSKYKELRVQSTYGLLDSINVRLIVENGYKFKKEPFLTRSSSIEDHATFGREMKFNKTEESIIYNTYYYNEDQFYGTVRVQWSAE